MSEKNTPDPAAKSPQDLQSENEVLAAKVAALEAALEEANKPAAKSGKGGSNLPTFTHGGKNYRFKIPGFSFDGVNAVHAADAVKDKALLAKIVEDYPGVIERV